MLCSCQSPVGHTAYNQIGLGASSTPYYEYGAQRRYANAWNGGPGGVPASWRSGEARELGMSLYEGLGPASPALARTRLHTLSDFPLVRVAGPEPTEGILDLSHNEKILLGAAAIALVGVVAWRRRGRRRRR